VSKRFEEERKPIKKNKICFGIYFKKIDVRFLGKG
jgi:hypothetical protein